MQKTEWESPSPLPREEAAPRCKKHSSSRPLLSQGRRQKQDAEPRGGADADARRRSTKPVDSNAPAAPAVVDAGASRDGEAFDEWSALDEELEKALAKEKTAKPRRR